MRRLKRYLALLCAILASSPVLALAEGEWQDSGCSSEPCEGFCAFFLYVMFFLGGLSFLFLVGATAYHFYKMRTDQEYREQEKMRLAEYEARERRRVR